MKELSWTPERKGAIYCAPACGRGCTIDEYESAVRKGDALCAALGDGWTPRIHENLGWYYCARNAAGTIEVHEYENYKPASYSAFINAPGELPGGRWVGEGRTPREAVEDGLRQAREDRDEINTILEATS